MAGLPNITGKYGYVIRDAHSGQEIINGGLYRSDHNDTWLYSGAGKYWTGRVALNFDASLASSIYGSSTTVTPLSLSSIFIIKY